MTNSRHEFKTNNDETLMILVTTDDYVIKSTIKDLPTDILERLAAESNVELLERDEEFEEFLKENANGKEEK